MADGLRFKFLNLNNSETIPAINARISPVPKLPIKPQAIRNSKIGISLYIGLTTLIMLQLRFG